MADPIGTRSLRHPLGRRRFIAAIAGGLLAAPLAAEAQQRPVPRIGILTGESSTDLLPALSQFRQELHKLGWIDGQTIIVLEPRSAEGRNERLSELAAEVLKADPQIIVAFGAPATRVLRQATATIPILMWSVGDPVGYGFVASLAKPGGNVTGTSTMVIETGGKLVELLKETVPAVARLALFVNPGNPGAASYAHQVQEVAEALRLKVQVLEVRRPDDFEGALAAIGGSALRPSSCRPSRSSAHSGGGSLNSRRSTTSHCSSTARRCSWKVAGC